MGTPISASWPTGCQRSGCRRRSIGATSWCSSCLPRKMFDGGGLLLLLSPTGSRLWRFKYRRLGLLQTSMWWARWVSNPRPIDYESTALTPELQALFGSALQKKTRYFTPGPALRLDHL